MVHLITVVLSFHVLYDGLILLHNVKVELCQIKLKERLTLQIIHNIQINQNNCF